MELADGLVVRRHLALALQHVDFHRRLVVRRRAENLALLGRDGRVALDQWGHYAAEGLNTQRQWGHVQQQHILDFALKHATLDRRAHGHDFIRVHALVRLLAQLLFDHLLHARHPGHAADQDHFIQLVLRQLGIAQTVLYRRHAPVNQVAHQLLQFCARQRHVQVLWPARIRRNERQVDVGALRAGQLALGLFRGFLQALQRHGVLGQVNAVVLLELSHQPINHPLVKVVTAEVRIAVGGLDLEHPIADFQHGDVKRPTAQVIDRNLLVGLLVQAVR